MKKFEVGKKYHPYVSGRPDKSITYECVFTLENQACLKEPNGTLFGSSYPQHYCEEAPEPRRGKRFMNVLDCGGSMGFLTPTYDSRKEADDSARNTGMRIACVEVGWTEGQGLQKSSHAYDAKCDCVCCCQTRIVK